MKKNNQNLIVKLLVSLIIIESIVVFLLLRPEVPKYTPKKIPKTKKVSPAVLQPVVVKGRIAIVLDDWGYNLNNLAVLKQIKSPLTLSILPNLAYSKEISERMHNLKYQIILHLPMEPKEKLRLENNTIMASMSEDTIRNIMNDDLNNIVYAKGISNHMGSNVTRDARVISVIFGELKKRGLFFLDSYVSNESVCSDMASKMGVGFIRRDIFLDNKNEPEYIRSQLYKLKSKAKIYGYAVGIGHDRRTTLEVLKEVMPELEKEGYKFVYLSELVN